jgi:hypothetical protein
LHTTHFRTNRRRFVTALLTCLTLIPLVAVAAPASAVPVASTVRINEVESSGGTPGDWVELTNIGTFSADVSGWIVKDNDDTHAYVIAPSTTIAPGGYLALDVESSFGLGSADSARLFEADGTTLVDSYSWTSHATTTYGRCPDGTGDFTTTTSSTKGAANDCSVAGAPLVRINEVESSGGTPGDWVELTNIGPSAADVSGWIVKDNDDSHMFVIPASTTIAAGGFLALDVDPVFGLGSADSARLYAADGTTLVDSYSWTAHAATTYGRCPDGTGAFVTTTSSTKGAANDCSSPVRINEVESNGGTPGDWIELTNTGATTADVSGWTLKDNDDTHAYVIAANTTIAAGGYLALDVESSFGLGSADSARLYAADGTTLVDSYSWTAHAATTYGRCPDGTGPFVTTTSSTKGAANDCPGQITAAPWPGSPTVATADDVNVFGTNLSGLSYEGSGSATPGVLWAVRNGPSTLYRLVWDGTKWTPDPNDGWSAGKALHYPDGTGDPDSEGVSVTGAGPAGGVYVSTERNNSDSGVSRPEVLRFDPSTAGTSLNATQEWNLTSDLPAVGANLGLEGISWIPDTFLTSKGFFDEHTGAAYDPTNYPDHGSGLFFVGLEANGTIYAYALDQATGGFTRVATISSGFPAVMDLEFEPETGHLWAACDDTCNGRTATLDIDHQAGPTAGRFAVTNVYERPASMPNLNNEGFAIAPQSECVNGLKPVFWSDDTNDDGHALRSGAIDCTVPAASQTITFTSTSATPVVGASYSVAATGGASGNPVVFSIDAASAAECSISGSTVHFDHPGSCVIDADQDGNGQYLPASATQSVTVTKASTHTSVVVHASTVTATAAAVSPGAGMPTGTVAFSVGGKVVGTASLTAGVATLSYRVPTGATRTIAAAYSGDGDFGTSSATATRQDPSITATITSAHAKTRYGWYRSSVKVTFHCTAHGAALTASCPAPVTFTHNGAGQAVTRTVTAVDGGGATIAVRGINIDAVMPSARITGVRNGAVYFGAAPAARCVAADALSRVAACRLTTKRHGETTTVTATATDRAGNVASTHVSYQTLTYYVRGATFHNGAFVLKEGHRYTLVALIPGTSRPRLYDAAPSAQHPRRADLLMHADGKQDGLHRFTLTVRIDAGMHHYKYWNFGIKVGHTMHLVKIHPVG